ncbi:MAG: hypothetical protein OZ921_03845 [Sorangiineae bacterium]|nr:hypothetical protein [Polyangiaceae bacterium]MEB2321623.1 hypothetical protein [Sorangiineae bacterium]
MKHRIVLASSLALAMASSSARALDKQGSAHGGRVGGSDHGFAASGALVLGAAVYNPSYAARPDNSGHALMRLAPHMDIDLTPELVGRFGAFEAHLAHERDLPVDRSGLVQELLLVHGVWSFDLTRLAGAPEPAE